MSFWQITLIILVVLVCLLYLVLIPIAKKKSLKKQNDEVSQMHANLQKGDEVILIDGIIGNIVSINETEARVKIAPNTIIRIKKMAIIDSKKVTEQNDSKSMEKAYSKLTKSEQA